MRKVLIVGMALMGLCGPALAAEMPESLRFCTGAEGGYYEKLGTTIGRKIVANTGIQLDIINTGGSVESAELLKEKECDIGLLQADAATVLALPPDIEVTDAHMEAIYWLHKAGGMDDFADMTDTGNQAKYSVAVITGGGSQITLRNFGTVEEDYKGIKPIEFDDWRAAGKAIAQGYTVRNGERIEIAGGLYIGRVNAITNDIVEDFGALIEVGEIDDGDFTDVKDRNGNQLYQQCKLTDKDTSGIELSSTLSVDTYCVRAQVIYNNDYHKTLDKSLQRKVSRMVAKGVDSEVKTVR